MTVTSATIGGSLCRMPLQVLLVVSKIKTTFPIKFTASCPPPARFPGMIIKIVGVFHLFSVSCILCSSEKNLNLVLFRQLFQNIHFPIIHCAEVSLCTLVHTTTSIKKI